MPHSKDKTLIKVIIDPGQPPQLDICLLHPPHYWQLIGYFDKLYEQDNISIKEHKQLVSMAADMLDEGWLI